MIQYLQFHHAHADGRDERRHGSFDGQRRGHVEQLLFQRFLFAEQRELFRVERRDDDASVGVFPTLDDAAAINRRRRRLALRVAVGRRRPSHPFGFQHLLSGTYR